MDNQEYEGETNKDLNFVSHKEHKDGFYEKIFNNKTRFDDMLCAFYIFDTIITNHEGFEPFFVHFLALFKVAFTKYLTAKFGDKINVNKHVIKIYEKDEKEIIKKTFQFVIEFVYERVQVDNDAEKTTEGVIKFLSKLSRYEKIKDSLDDLNISVQDIEDIVLEDKEVIIESDDSKDKYNED